MKKVLYILLFLTTYFFVGCATQKPMYFWGNYSSSLYAYKKTPNEENLLKHKKELLKIIEESKARGLRVPPGVYCEYGYILMKEGKNEEALKYYELEEQTYPESTIFIQHLKSQINKNMD
jgi:hypothetical protein